MAGVTGELGQQNELRTQLGTKNGERNAEQERGRTEEKAHDLTRRFQWFVDSSSLCMELPERFESAQHAATR
jgi:hypothetical protein